MKDPIFSNMKEESYNNFIISAFMIKVLKYGDNGMKLKLEDFKDGRLVGKTIQITQDGNAFVFKVVNDPRN